MLRLERRVLKFPALFWKILIEQILLTEKFTKKKNLKTIIFTLKTKVKARYSMKRQDKSMVTKT